MFDRAIRESNLPMAWGAAAGLEQVELHRALALTLLLARSGDPRYEESAQRFLSCLPEEAVGPSAR